MKKIKMIGVVFAVLLLSMGVVFAGSDYENQRYLVKSNNGVLKMMYGVRHSFDSGFTTDLSPGQLKVLEKFGVDVEEVEIYSITVKPVCGNGIIEGGEKCGEPGLGCPIGFVCDNCKCVEGTTPEPPPEPEPCTPSTQMPWGITKVNGGESETDVIVAVLDTGIDTDHPDLVGNIIDAHCVGIGHTTCEDDNGHGTHVAGTIAANGKIIGVAPDVSLMAIKVLDSAGSGWTDDIAKGIEYAADNGASIISMSLGGDRQSSLIKEAIDYAVSEGVLVIAAAGNDGPRTGSIDYPGANVNVLAVGAIDSKEKVPRWSSRGINDGDYIVEEREVEFGAPGVSIESTWNDGCYDTISGTSMATPHVAGLAAKLWETDAGTTRTKLQELARLYDLYVGGDDSATGFGLPIAIN
ncbi:S8 family peptidase [Candidatus Pacearchaeota archaeon]|nr:S8 family peptidase [Candidatus Pacearchaeota archaeon]